MAKKNVLPAITIALLEEQYDMFHGEAVRASDALVRRLTGGETADTLLLNRVNKANSLASFMELVVEYARRDELTPANLMRITKESPTLDRKHIMDYAVEILESI